MAAQCIKDFDMQKIVIGVISCIFSLGCMAGNDDKELKEKARRNIASDLEAFSKAQQNCKESEIVLPNNVFEGLDLSNEQKKLVLIYSVSKANYECTKPEMINYLVSSSILSHYAPQEAENLGKGSMFSPCSPMTSALMESRE